MGANEKAREYIMNVYGEKGDVVGEEVRISRIDLPSLLESELQEFLYDFDCLYVPEVERGYGKIQKITFNSLFIRMKDNVVLEFKLGLCSRL